MDKEDYKQRLEDIEESIKQLVKDTETKEWVDVTRDCKLVIDDDDQDYYYIKVIHNGDYVATVQGVGTIGELDILDGYTKYYKIKMSSSMSNHFRILHLEV